MSPDPFAALPELEDFISMLFASNAAGELACLCVRLKRPMMAVARKI